jgi:hypothetical protein|nr:MAG TPA: hypothetical protein [Caudoviricetes sp.]
MKKDSLKQYRFCKKRIAEIDEEIDKLKRENTVQDTVQGSQKDFPYIMRTRTVSGCPGIYDNNSKINQLYAERAKCRRIVKEVSIFVNSIEDNIIRRAFIMRYMEGSVPPKWDKIALKIGGGNTADSIRMTVSRYIEKS